MAGALRAVPLLAHTHGQPATPRPWARNSPSLTWRLGRQLARIERAEYLGKFNGATGTYGAHLAAVPDADWQRISAEFCRLVGLTWNPADHADREPRLAGEPLCGPPASIASCTTSAPTSGPTSRSATSRRSAAQGTIGSSTMPHKVNPIRFENAEANLEVSNALLDVLRPPWSPRGCSAI